MRIRNYNCDWALQDNAAVKTEEDKLGQTVIEAKVEIKNADGLHMRPAMHFVDVASQFESDITVENGPTSVDGKSIMQMSMLAATCGTKLSIKAQGEDAQKAVDALVHLVEEKKFEEK